MRNQSIKKPLFSCFTIVFFILSVLFSVKPVMAAEQTTIIILDPDRNYDIGETVKVTVGVASTDGSYLKSADVGFGYNGATMELLTETEVPDRFTIESDTPKKWLYGTLEFKMKANGKMFFIAGAYDGDGVIKAVRADGSPITLPRASVVYKIGTGIYTKVSDCNLSEVKFSYNNEPINPEREFDKMITEYWISVESLVDKLEVSTVTENAEDEVILPDMTLVPGDNEKRIIVRATDGVEKEYIFHVHRPADPVTITDIEIFEKSGKKVEYTFDQNITEYNIEVDNTSDIVNLTLHGSDTTKMELPDMSLEVGFNIKKVRLYTDSDEKVYQFNFFRKSSPLALTSLIVEASDETVPTLSPEFNSDTQMYFVNVQPDVKNVKLIYTLGNATDHVVEDNLTYELHPGTNECNLTVTDGVNERVYTINVIKPEYEKVETTTEAPKDDRNTKEFTEVTKRNLLPLAIVSGILLIGIIAFFGKRALDVNRDWNDSYEAKCEREEKDRKKRLKEMKRNREKKKK